MARASKTSAAAAVETVAVPSTFGAAFKAKIDAANLTMNKLASRSGVSPSTINQIVGGKIRLTPTAAIFVAASLNVDPVELLNEQNAGSVADALASLDAEDQARLTFIKSVS